LESSSNRASEHVPHILRCYELADEAVARGNHPFGALLVVDGEVVAAARNEAVVSRDPTRHAEMVLLSKALALLTPEVRIRAVLYSSTEPCTMCSGAIYWSGIATVVFGCSAAALASAAGSDFLVPCPEIFARGQRRVDVIGPVLEAEGRAKHLSYWKRLDVRPGPAGV
jgi:tRNA(Arg) A34 adenosine deaminase TadA